MNGFSMASWFPLVDFPGGGAGWEGEGVCKACMPYLTL